MCVQNYETTKPQKFSNDDDEKKNHNEQNEKINLCKQELYKITKYIEFYF